MKRSGIAFLSLILSLIAATSLAGPPLVGDYDSTDLGGLVYVGRYTEGWNSGGGALMSGTILNAASWDGAALATQWHYWCATEASDASLLIDNVNGSGNGNRTYMKTFEGGYIWLSGTGPWGNGDSNYPGLLDEDCNATCTEGAFWDFFSITLSISNCTVGTEQSSWGAIKLMYAD
jgi:hypothetical protein